MTLWDFIEQKLLPLFGEISPWALERVERIYWIVLGCCIVLALVYLPFKACLVLLGKCKWKDRWLL